MLLKPPASFLQTMEEYVREAPRMSSVRKDQVQRTLCLISLCWMGKSEQQNNTRCVYHWMLYKLFKIACGHI